MTTGPAVRTVSLQMTAYQLAALRLLVRTDVERTERDNPHRGPGPDPRDWTVAMRAIDTMLESHLTAREAATAIATHYLAELEKE